MREVIARIGGEAGINALYWQGGICVYETTTRSRALIEQNMSSTWQGRIRLQAQGGQAEVLLEQLTKQIEAAQTRIGLRPANVEHASARHPTGRMEPVPASGFGADVPEMKLAYSQPPVTQPEWFVSYA